MYAPVKQELAFEEVEAWVLSLVEEGADFSEFTWEEASYAYQEYISEKKKDDPLDMASHPGLAQNNPDNKGKSGRDVVGTGVTPGSKEDRAQQNRGRATTAPGGRQYGLPTSNPTSKDKDKSSGATYNQDKFDSTLGDLKKTINMANSGSGNKEKPKGGGGTETQKDDPKGGSGTETQKDDPKPSTQQPPTQQPSRRQPSTSTSTSSSSKVTPAAPPKDRMADKSKSERMSAWAKANPKLAAAKKKRDETRGTSKSTNPLLTKDMKARMPSSKKPSTPSSSTSRISQATSDVKPTSKGTPFDKAGAALRSGPKPTSTPASTSTPKPKTKFNPGGLGQSFASKTPLKTGNVDFKKKAEPFKEEYDDFDIILAHLIESGFGDDEALSIMSTMSPEKREEILKKI